MSIEDTVRNLETRLDLLEDKDAIFKTVCRYGFTADLGLADAYVDTWTSDGVYDTTKYGKWNGAEDLRHFITDPDGPHKSQIEGRSQHTVSNLMIEVDGDRAWAEGYSGVVIFRDDAFGMFNAGYNHWEFVRDGSRWRVSKRTRVNIGDPTGPSGTAIMTEFQKAL